VLPGFPNSADLGGLPLPGGRAVPSGRIVRADTPARLDGDERAAAEAAGFTTVVDLRSADELLACPHPLTGLPGYRSLPLIDPVAEAREDISRYPTLGEIYASSLQRNAGHIAAIFAALAAAPPGPVLVSCRAGRDRTGMVVALLLDLAGVDRDVIAADYALVPDRAAPADAASIRRMLDHVGGAYGTTAGYLRRLGLDEAAVAGLRRRLEP
jgi:protein tyrosine/serine phosphatase